MAVRLIKMNTNIVQMNTNWDSDWSNTAPAPSSDQNGWTADNMMYKDHVFNQLHRGFRRLQSFLINDILRYSGRTPAKREAL